MRLYWQANDDVIQSWDSDSGEVSTLVTAQTDPLGIFRFGTLREQGDGRIIIDGRHAGDFHQAELVVSPDLSVSGAEFRTSIEHPFDDNSGRSTYSTYDNTGGLYDPVRDVNWSTKTVNSEATPWEWFGYNNDGSFKMGRGDVSLIHPGDAYRFIGSNIGVGPQASLIGDWLYRASASGDAIVRYNLVDNRWQNIYYAPDPSSEFIGVLPDGTLVDARGQSADGLVRLYPPETILWTDITTLPAGNTLYTPDQEEHIIKVVPEGLDLSGVVIGNGGERSSLIVGTDLIYPHIHTFVDWGSPALTWYKTNLLTLEITELVTIPYQAYDEEANPVSSSQANSNNYYADNFTNPPIGLVFATQVTQPGRLLINVGDDDAREFKFFNPKAGENDGVGVGFINVGNDDDRDWRQVRELPDASFQLQVGDDDDPIWVPANK